MSGIRTVALLGAVLVGVGLGGCSRTEDLLTPAQLPDPCAMISDDVMQRLAPGSTREPVESVGGDSGYRQCQVDLTAGSFSGDLGLELKVGDGFFDKTWRKARCARIGGTPSDAGPGDTSCVVVTPWKDGEGRFDAYAWIDDDYEVWVVYQMIEPEEFPAGAEQDLRALLAAGIDAISAK